jgi:hypothetical protein
VRSIIGNALSATLAMKMKNEVNKTANVASPMMTRKMKMKDKRKELTMHHSPFDSWDRAWNSKD